MRSEPCSSDFLFFQPVKIILALLRCSLQSLGEYLKRLDQSASGQFHQHLNTCFLFLCESIYLSFPFSHASSFSFPSLSPLSLLPLFRIYLNNPQPFGSFRVDGQLAKRAEKSKMNEKGRAGWEVFKSVG